VDARPATIEAVIFDLDGVIVDSEIWWHEIRVAWAAGRGLTWTLDDTAAVMGANSRGWARIMRQRLGLAVTEEPAIERSIIAGVVDRYRVEGAPTIAGAVEAVLRIAQRWPVAVASSAHREVIDVALSATGLGGIIRIVVSSDDVEHGKPSPDVYLEAARQLGVAPEACLVVEDSINGVRAGSAAGMTVVLVPNAALPPASGAAESADLVLARLADLDPARVTPRWFGRPLGR
jgi:HAD superfamily hydrolase (TIGR01509 family)